jgi:hypothetical protein
LRSLPSRSATMMLTPHEPGRRAVAARPIPPLCPHHAASSMSRVAWILGDDPR